MRICPSRLLVYALLMLLSACQHSGTVNQSKADRAKLAQINTQLGFQYMQEGEYEIALGKLEKALAADPDFVDAHNAMGLLRGQLGQDEDAEREFKRALRLQPTNPAALNNYGQFLCQRGRYAEGQAQFLNAVKNPLYKSPSSAFSNAGTCAVAAGDLEGAETHFRHALELEPKLGPALIQMADLSYRRAHYLPARGYLQRYLEVARHTASSLWLGIQIERELGDRDAVASYALQLERSFPDSVETGLLLESKNQ